MSEWNDRAREPKTRAITQAWVRETCPLIYIYAPSKAGKTTLLGTALTQAKVYGPAHVIDGDNGLATLGEYLESSSLLDVHAFDQHPDDLFAWTMGKLDAATAVECKSIMYEGLTCVHDRLLTIERLKNLGAEGNAARRAHIGPAVDMRCIIDAIRRIKQYRIYKKTGVPIFVTVNTKRYDLDPTKIGGTQVIQPSMSVGLIDKMLMSADAVIELTRSADNNTRLITLANSRHPYVALRYAPAAQAVQDETNLSLPGMLALWASLINEKAVAIAAKLDKKHKTNPAPNTPADKDNSQ
jgi:hypothetical protein